MKKIVLICMISALVACSEKQGADEAAIELGTGQKSEIVLDADGDIVNVRFTSAKDWHVVADGAEWLEISPMEGTAGTGRVKFKADENMTSGVRTAVVNLCSEDVVVPLYLSQEPFVATFELLDTEKEISCLGGEFEIKVHTDVEYEYDCDAEWVHLPGTKAPHTHAITVAVDPNSSEERTAVITFCSGMTCKAFTLTQRAVGTEADDWKEDDFARRSLAMRFTADWCGYCPYMAQAFETARSMMPGRLEVVSLHGDGGLEMTGVTTLGNKYRVQGYPTGIIDGRASIPNYSNTSETARAAAAVAEELHAFRAPSVGIAVKSSTVTSRLEAEVTLYVKEAGAYRVTVLLLEDDIIAYQNGVSNTNSYEHDHVARLALSSITGDAVTVENDNTVWTGTFTGTIPSKCNKDNLRLLVYVNKPYGDDVLPANVADVEYVDYTGTYIDNCVSVEVGKEHQLFLN